MFDCRARRVWDLHSIGYGFNIELILFIRLFLHDGAMTNSRSGSNLFSTGNPEDSCVLMTVDSVPFNRMDANIGLLAVQVSILMGLLPLSWCVVSWASKHCFSCDIAQCCLRNDSLSELRFFFFFLLSLSFLDGARLNFFCWDRGCELYTPAW